MKRVSRNNSLGRYYYVFFLSVNQEPGERGVKKKIKKIVKNTSVIRYHVHDCGDLQSDRIVRVLDAAVRVVVVGSGGLRPERQRRADYWRDGHRAATVGVVHHNGRWGSERVRGRRHGCRIPSLRGGPHLDGVVVRGQHGCSSALPPDRARGPRARAVRHRAHGHGAGIHNAHGLGRSRVIRTQALDAALHRYLYGHVSGGRRTFGPHDLLEVDFPARAFGVAYHVRIAPRHGHGVVRISGSARSRSGHRRPNRRHHRGGRRSRCARRRRSRVRNRFLVGRRADGEVTVGRGRDRPPLVRGRRGIASAATVTFRPYAPNGHQYDGGGGGGQGHRTGG